MRRTLAGLLLCIVIVNGCAQSIDATSLGVRATLAEPAAAPPTGTPFRISRRATYLFWGVLPVGQQRIDAALGSQLADSPGIADLRIETKAGFTDVLLTVLTAGIVVSRSVTYEGIILPPSR